MKLELKLAVGVLLVAGIVTWIAIDLRGKAVAHTALLKEQERRAELSRQAEKDSLEIVKRTRKMVLDSVELSKYQFESAKANLKSCATRSFEAKPEHKAEAQQDVKDAMAEVSAASVSLSETEAKLRSIDDRIRELEESIVKHSSQ